MLKPSTQNIITWWFAADTPIRRYKIDSNPALKKACEQVSRSFTAPSGAVSSIDYQPTDKLVFAQAVEKLLKSSID